MRNILISNNMKLSQNVSTICSTIKWTKNVNSESKMCFKNAFMAKFAREVKKQRKSFSFCGTSSSLSV